MELRANELGTILLSFIAMAERDGRSDLATNAIRAAREALLEIPDAFSDEFLLRAAAWRNSVETARALLDVFDANND